MSNDGVVNLLKNIGTLAVCPEDGKQENIQLIHDAALAWKDDTIIWSGWEANMPEFQEIVEVHDAEGRLVIPGLIDCHTHLAFGGWRPEEFEMRSLGRTYEQIASAGGGILSTMKSTRAISQDDLFAKCSMLLDKMISLGVTTIECKSGYGLTVEDELKQLQVYRKLQSQSQIRMLSTFLGAHAIPPEYKHNRNGYVDLVVNEMLPRVIEGKLAQFCDVFADAPAFTNEEAESILTEAKSKGLTPKLHADQLTANGGAELAAKVGAISADHLECISDEGIRAMSEAGTVAVSLPLASYYLRKDPLPARSLIEAEVPVAVSTDFNPGSAPSYHLPMAMHLACTLQYMSPAEVLKGATIFGAKALGLEDEVGSLEHGKKADFVELDVASVNQWMYHFQPNCAARVWAGGDLVIEELI